MYKLLIADDEPLVQIGLKTLFSTGFDDIEIIAACSNGKEALDYMEKELPDIVITDIRMPLMSGLDLLRESTKRYGSVPAFIMLTAYEEFDLAKQALSLQAVDYLVKIELNRDILKDAIRKAIARVNSHTSALSIGQAMQSNPIDEYRQKFLLRIFSHTIPDEDALLLQANDLHLNLDYRRFIVVYGGICEETQEQNKTTENESSKLISLYSSCANMSSEILSRHAPCYFVIVDTKHFASIFYFDEDEPIADMNARIHDALSNVHTMIHNYFNVEIRFGIGTAVTDAMNIATSYEEAKIAQAHTDHNTLIRLFSHIVGANRRSGKDKLIAAVQEYIGQNIDSRLQLSETADVFGLSPAYLSVLFKKNADMGFSEYVNSKKIAKAKEMLLSGDMKIYEVADALGFESAYYFSKVFKKVDGHSPREYIRSKSIHPEDH